MTPKKCAVIVDAAKTIDFKHEYVAHFSRDHVRAKFAAVNKDFLDLFMEAVIITGEEFKLPCFMGSFQLVKRPARNKTRRAVDWTMTKKLYGEYNKGKALKDRKVVHFEKTLIPGYHIKLLWSKSKFQSSFKNKKMFSFTPSRSWFRDTSSKTLRKRLTILKCAKSESVITRYHTLDNYTVQII